MLARYDTIFHTKENYPFSSEFLILILHDYNLEYTLCECMHIVVCMYFFCEEQKYIIVDPPTHITFLKYGCI
jgi:hypothetical protein